MAKRRGRPSRAEQKHALTQGASAISELLRRHPLRQPVEPQFDPYYKRILDGDLTAVLDYCDRHSWPELESGGSFYELIGRLVPLQSVAAARQVISQIAHRGVDVIDPAPPQSVIYLYWYNKLKPLCRDAREFIREKYKRDAYIKPKQLWHEYIEKFYYELRKRSGIAWGRNIVNELQAQTEAAKDDTGRSDALCHLIDLFTLRGVVPQPIFFELASANSRRYPKRDRRYRERSFRQTPSSIARKYACEMAGISVSTVSRRNVHK